MLQISISPKYKKQEHQLSSVKQNYLSNPIKHSNIPTMNANNMANSVYSSLDELTIPPRTLETSRETSATGPTANCREEPKIA
jgi:hypothetical protein